MTKREEQELAEATRRVVARWSTMSRKDRIVRLKAAGILDAAGELASRYRATPDEEKPRSGAGSR